MRILILGMGHLGRSLAKVWTQSGHEVIGTTTTPAKVDGLLRVAPRVEVVKASDRGKIRELGADVDAIVNTIAPKLEKTVSAEARHQSYHDALVVSSQNAAAANDRVLFCSSFSVYGSGRQCEEPITEEAALTDATDASPANYRRAEQAVLAAPAGVVLRLPDIHGAPGDMSWAERVQFGHRFMQGRVPFGPRGLLYSIHYEDVVGAVDHALRRSLVGVYNVCDDQTLPPTNQVAFDRICDAHQWPRLTFLDEIQTPEKRISSAKLMATGFHLQHRSYDIAVE